MVLFVVYILVTIDCLALGLLMPVSGVHVLELGGTRFLIGILGSLHCFLQLVSGPIIGSLSDTKGRKQLLLITCVGSLIANSLLLFNSLPIYILSRLIYGFTCQVQVLIKALVGDNCSGSGQQAAVFGKIGALFALSFIAGPIISGHINEYENGFYYTALLVLGLNVITIVLTLFLPTVVPKQANETKNPLDNLRGLDWKNYGDIFLIKFLAESAYSIFYGTFGLIFTDVFHVSYKNLGYIIAFHSVALILANLIIPTVKQKYYADDPNYKKRNLHSFLGLCLSFLVLYSFPAIYMNIVFLVPFSAFKTLLETTWTEMVVGRTTDKDRGTVMGAYESIMQLAGLGSPIISGYIGEVYGHNTNIGLCIVPLVIAAAFSTRLATQKVKDK